MVSRPAAVDDSFDRDFVIRIGHRTIRWEFWPQCVAATRSGTRCLQTSVVDNPGRSRDGAYDIENRETYGSWAAEALRRLLTQRCHLHDNSTPAAVEFEGQVSAGNEDWRGELQQVAAANAIRAEQTREANRQRLIATKCPTCGVVDALKCVQSSGRPKLKGFHMPRLQAAFGETNQGRLPIV
ncbi:hypothetical protein GCM10009789_82910 [Kribbella sancticallisti]|uniref:Uncharacterized protein n=2 Tax=Kribbella sancticallisti TaxID=460087 RepID=A0ABN2ESH0_9ACTN